MVDRVSWWPLSVRFQSHAFSTPFPVPVTVAAERTETDRLTLRMKGMNREGALVLSRNDAGLFAAMILSAGNMSPGEVREWLAELDK